MARIDVLHADIHLERPTAEWALPCMLRRHDGEQTVVKFEDDVPAYIDRHPRVEEALVEILENWDKMGFDHDRARQIENFLRIHADYGASNRLLGLGEIGHI